MAIIVVLKMKIVVHHIPSTEILENHFNFFDVFFLNNKVGSKFYKKSQITYTAISMITTFAVLMYLILPTNVTLAYLPTTPEESGCNPETDTNCFPKEIFTSGDSTNAQPLALNNQFKSSIMKVGKSEVIEMKEIVVKGCEGGTKGELPGKPGVCKEG